MLTIKTFCFNLFGENTYVVYDLSTLETAIIDPGMMTAGESEALVKFVSDNHLKIKYLLNTHLHVDHVAGDLFVEEKYGVGLSASDLDLPLGERVAEQARMFGLKAAVPSRIEIAHPLAPGDRLPLGDDSLEVLAVPGHSPGSLAFYSAESGVVFTGDALFLGSIGRTDLPGGNYAQLIKSITDNLLVLPPATVVYPGHGPATTIGDEERSNPYL